MNNSSLPTLTLGFDLGDRRHSFCLIDAQARILEEASVANSSEALAALSARFPEARIVIETGSSYQRTPARLSPLHLSPGATLPDHCGASLA